jgi:hypothetical protein
MSKEGMIKRIVRQVLSPRIKHQSERVILLIAIVSYLLHLMLILLSNYDVIQIESKLLKNPIAAIYTPFSFILVYEVYLLIFFLPKSISVYIGKQYEIITLIVIRRIFKDIANLEFTTQWFQSNSDLQFTYDVLTSLLLFFIIYLFYHNIVKRVDSTNQKSSMEIEDTARFVHLKKTIATLLVPVLLILAAYTFYIWFKDTWSDYAKGVMAFKNINNIFFEEFFTILIVVDVLLLLSSFFYSDKFHKIIRNSGFVISTVLIKMSFSIEGILNNFLIIGAVLFGLLILIIHNKYEKNADTRDN